MYWFSGLPCPDIVRGTAAVAYAFIDAVNVFFGGGEKLEKSVRLM